MSISLFESSSLRQKLSLLDIMKIFVIELAYSQSRCKTKSREHSFYALPFLQGDAHSLNHFVFSRAQAVLVSLLTGFTQDNLFPLT